MQEIKYIPVSKLIPHQDNPRIVKDKQFKTLCDSIKANADFFEVRPILCNPQFIVFAGNQRLRAAIEVGLKKVPVSIMDISEERQREIMFRDNVSNGEWDFDMLANQFNGKELLDWGVNLPISDLSENQDESTTVATDKNLNKCSSCGHEW